MRMYDLIERKKQGGALTEAEISEMIRAYTAGEIPDYQMSAFLMAVYFRGMTDSEMFCLTEAMAASGDTVDLSCFGTLSVDKHSTGGVGDKTTLVVAPIVAACGGVVAKMSGRGLGHTGGTVDKLESFPGFRTSLSPEDFRAQVRRCGLAVIGQSGDLAPADKKMYALRDVTATVDSIPLIAASIMSKKLAAGTRSIVLDVKCGSGAFMRTPEDATRLADAMVRIGRAHGRSMAALITDMNLPLGHAIGNVLEVQEAIEVLRGKGPADLREVALALACRMVQLSLGKSLAEAKRMTEEALDSGRAYERFCTWIGQQGGDPAYAEDPALFGEAAYSYDCLAPKDGYLLATEAARIGTAAMVLGAGRSRADDVIDPRAGILLYAKPGDRVRKGQPVARLLTEREQTLAPAAELFASALVWGEEAPAKTPLIYAVIDGEAQA